MSFTVFLGNLPVWVTADDIRGWLSAENLVADAIKVIRNPETQESKGFAFIEAPNIDEMNAIIRRFDRAPLEDRLLRANPAQPPKPKGQVRPSGPGHAGQGHAVSGGGASAHAGHRPPRHAGPPAATRAGHAGHAANNVDQPAGHISHIDQADSQLDQPPAAQAPPAEQRPPRRGKKSGGKRNGNDGSSSAFAEELAKAL